MKKNAFLFILLLLTALMQAQDRPQPKPSKPPIVNIKKPQTFTLANGLKVLIVEDHKLPRATFSLTMDTAPFLEKDKKGVDDLTSNLMGNGGGTIQKDDFNEEIDFLGASIQFSSSGAYASTLSKYAGRVLELLSYGILSPNFTQEELDKEKAKMLEALKSQEKNTSAIASRVVNALTFGKNHPGGEFATPETIKKVSLNDVVENYKKHFNPENAYLIIIGDIAFDQTKKTVETLFDNWKKTNVIHEKYTNPKNVKATQINFIDVPNASQSEISLVNTVNLKMNATDYFAASMATFILGGDYNSYLNMNLREKNAWTYGANTSIGVSKYIDKLRSTAAVRISATDSAVVEFVKEIKKIRTEKVSEELLKEIKAGFIGRFIMRVEKPQTIARYALNIRTEDLPDDFYETYIQKINAVTPKDILKAAKKYFLIDNTRIIIAGKGEEVIPGLEKLNFPISYFDKYGNTVEKPKY